MKFLLTLLAITGMCRLYAGNNDTVYFDSHWKRLTSSEHMAYYRLPVIKTDSGYRVVDCYKNGQMEMLAYASNSSCSIYDGYKIIYYSNGKKKREGNLVKGMRQGLWRSYRENGTLGFEMNYAGDELNGAMINYDSFGYKRYIEEYKDGYLDGTRTVYYKGGDKVYVSEHYNNGKPDAPRKAYYESGKLKREDEYIASKRAYKGKCYDANGKKNEYFSFSEAPELPENFWKTIYTRLKARKDIIGKIEISFIVDKSGKLGQVSIEHSETELDEEDIKKSVETLAGQWKPGRFDGQPAAYKYYVLLNMDSNSTFYDTRFGVAHEITY